MSIDIVEKMKNAVDKGKILGALLTDLSKACDCLDDELLIAKLNACRFSLSALKLIYNYQTKRKQGTKVNNFYGEWLEIISRYLRGPF